MASQFSAERSLRDLLGKTAQEICDGMNIQLRSDNSSNPYHVARCRPVLRQVLLDRFSEKQKHLRETMQHLKLEDLQDYSPRNAGLQKYFPLEVTREVDCLINYFIKKGILMQKHESTSDALAEKERLIDELTKPRIAFHGTCNRGSHGSAEEVVDSITDVGFLLPGDVHPQTGTVHKTWSATWGGVGIYTTPEVSYALQFTTSGDETAENPSLPDSVTLIVCAVLLGRAGDITNVEGVADLTEPFLGMDSHLFTYSHPGSSLQFLEYVLFDKAQILPCYVVQLERARRSTKDESSIEGTLESSTEYVAPVQPAMTDRADELTARICELGIIACMPTKGSDEFDEESYDEDDYSEEDASEDEDEEEDCNDEEESEEDDDEEEGEEEQDSRQGNDSESAN